MTRRRIRNATAGFAAIVIFFGALAYYTGLQRGQDAAYSALSELSQDETPQTAYSPLTAENDPHRIICDGGYGWNGHMDAQNDVFCHPFFTASAEEAPVLAAYQPERAGISPSPRNKPRRSLDNAVTSAIARNAGLSQVQHSSSPDPLAVALALGESQTDQDNPPTLPGNFSLAPISPGFSFGGGGGSGGPPSGGDNNDGDTPVEDNPPTGGEPPAENPPVEENPPTETPEEPEMPLPPLDPVDPTPIDPVDPTGPSDVPDPTVVPIPGALMLWAPGLAAVIFAARRKRRAKASVSS